MTKKQIQTTTSSSSTLVFIALALTIPAVAYTTIDHAVEAQILEKDPAQPLPIGGNATITTLTDRDVAIDPTDEPLPVNGTISIRTEGATDYDITSMVPQGMTIVITNTTATVTNHPVTIDRQEREE